ncbi:hypothetical protein THTE_3252 [Thermogutta terrifontis]|uniref:Uncharacterized protein n=1 Tax=Thermogutta terrifontis TaxID=1331910 RepID=A0A286RIS2_9BACT|nr:hypothetical protein THTE_3252 [Thermogutta terrifontis]
MPKRYRQRPDRLSGQVFQPFLTEFQLAGELARRKSVEFRVGPAVGANFNPRVGERPNLCRRIRPKTITLRKIVLKWRPRANVLGRHKIREGHPRFEKVRQGAQIIGVTIVERDRSRRTAGPSPAKKTLLNLGQGKNGAMSLEPRNVPSKSCERSAPRCRAVPSHTMVHQDGNRSPASFRQPPTQPFAERDGGKIIHRQQSLFYSPHELTGFTCSGHGLFLVLI